MTDRSQLRQQAFERLRLRLLAERAGQPFWQGRLSDSALATAVAVGALAQADACRVSPGLQTAPAHAAGIAAGLDWLAATQNADGGWGDSPDSPSNLSTTALVVAAWQLAGRQAPAAATQYLASFGPLAPAILKAYGDDRTFSAPILAFCALAGLTEWAEAPQLPFELAALPQRMFRFLRLSVVSYALPALIAIGLVRAAKGPPGSRARGALQRAITAAVLRRLGAIQPESGGFLEAVPLTSFVALSLTAAGHGRHEVVRRCIEFILRTVRPNGCWPIDVDLSVWNTTMAVHALGGEVGEDATVVRDWLLARQRTTRHPYTGSEPGGWGWTHHSGSVPDADDTAGALLALAKLPASEASVRAAAAGARWLLGLQNRDGGWPTFCRGWGKLEFDRSGCDLTAHAIRALHRWRTRLPMRLQRRAERAIERGLNFLAASQRPDGSWLPLWFGSQRMADQANPLFGTSRVLLAYRDLALTDTPPGRRGMEFLLESINGILGCRPEASRTRQTAALSGAPRPSVEEIAAAAEALAGWPDGRAAVACEAALDWLVAQIGPNGQVAPAPIGLYFAKLWYSETLYPMSMAAAALRAAGVSGTHE